MNNAGGGTDGCRCADGTAGVLASLVERQCRTADGDAGAPDGVMLAAEGPCVPHAYGSGCHKHDLLHDDACRAMVEGIAEDGAKVDEHCLHEWCYVDAKSCMESSAARVFRSTAFPRGEGVDLFYSYEACGSSFEYHPRDQPQQLLNGIAIEAAIPRYQEPFMFKRDEDDEILDDLDSMGSEYYDSSVPYEGILINYFNSLMEISRGDLNLTYTFGSKASKILHNHSSSFTAAVQDIEDGLVDMAVGPFWMTKERLRMTPFTVPLYYDRALLVVKKPGKDERLVAQMGKVLDPFSGGTWCLIIALILATAVLSVWFNRRVKTRHHRVGQKHPSRKTVYARLALDEFLHKGIFFCSAGVEQDTGASLPQKLLLFGFSFFILIAVSAYVANLAAFLTRSDYSYVDTIEGVKREGWKICAAKPLEPLLNVKHRNVQFVFPEGAEYDGVLQDYANGKCEVLAISDLALSPNKNLEERMCEENLVFTDSLVIENPVAFPVRPELASGISYWMYQAEKFHGVTLESTVNNYNLEHNCSLKVSEHDQEMLDEFAAIEVANLTLPIVFFLGCAFLAILAQLYNQKSLSGGVSRTLFGRASSLDKLCRQESCKKDDEAQLPQAEVNAITALEATESNASEVYHDARQDPPDPVQDRGFLDGFRDSCLSTECTAASFDGGLGESNDDQEGSRLSKRATKVVSNNRS